MRLPLKVRRFVEGKGYEIVEVERGTVIAPLLSEESERVIIVNGKPEWRVEKNGSGIQVKLGRKGDAIAVENERDAIVFVSI